MKGLIIGFALLAMANTASAQVAYGTANHQQTTSLCPPSGPLTSWYHACLDDADACVAGDPQCKKSKAQKDCANALFQMTLALRCVQNADDFVK